MSTHPLRTADQAALVTLTAIGSLLGHHGGDYLVQTDTCAAHKQDRTPAGRRALAIHAGTYALTQAVTKAALYRLAGLRVPAAAQLAGALTEALVHAVIDDGRLLEVYARRTRRSRFFGLAGAGINGKALLDQAAHVQVQIPAGIAATAAVAALAARRR
ncbi:hypothetical protein Ae406Ps2_3010c [Pseudonocardia sp. Ae406_Ps2]|uniref:DUF3307 domain-containing protein n=1 Tax=unclassified Pseudonocardia TaxID=2619320 RepID=UPI000964F1C3|nr:MULTISPECIES: DUF3307 domain-containing protein [unclassified Pseudonocardia]OLL99250.1 hypothetical protein Ae331Ps2_2917 [Pseudonocardia sp. Ae331_Ps2]OLM03010.1 hypothetical protein Ae406Ps2_3010c [Pseudonocardia sp. Ae406_Ps2]OLM12136.1 hypothetical protein Ae505Ps2_2263 [Pseudonocardia sp. Ae505_Ps2]